MTCVKSHSKLMVRRKKTKKGKKKKNEEFEVKGVLTRTDLGGLIEFARPSHLALKMLLCLWNLSEGTLVGPCSLYSNFPKGLKQGQAPPSSLSARPILSIHFSLSKPMSRNEESGPTSDCPILSVHFTK